MTHAGDQKEHVPVILQNPESNIGDTLSRAEKMSLAGNIGEAINLYRSVIRKSNKYNLHREKADAMRRLGHLYWRKGEAKKAMQYYRKSLSISQEHGDVSGCAKAYNGIGTLYFNTGNWNKVKEYYNQAVEAARKKEDLGLLADIYNNLGTMSNILGDRTMAISYYEEAISIYDSTNDARGLSRAYNNLGLTYRDRGDWEKAWKHHAKSIQISEKTGDVSLISSSSLNCLHVLIQLSKYDEAREKCDEIFELLSGTEEEANKAEAMMMYGMIYTRMGKLALAEKHFLDCVNINETHNNIMGKAECFREMAFLYREWGRNKQALEFLGKSFNAFGSLRAVRYLQDIDHKIEELEEFAFKIIRDMGTEVESKDTYTFGHSQRVAHYSMELAKKLHIEENLLKGIMVAAYLHDLGKVKMSEDILLKERKLTPEEYYIIQMHPIWGAEILKDIDFPWEVESLVRFHQERWDGSGYPDGLSGEAIPLGARVIAVTDFFDALTTDRPYRPAYSLKQALKILRKELGISLDPRIGRKFIRIVKERLPADLEGSLSSMSVASFIDLWSGIRSEEKASHLLKREVTLSSIVRAS